MQHLNVKHIVICGHYRCGGVKAVMEPKDQEILNPWLRSIRGVYRLHRKELNTIANEQQKYDRLVELNMELVDLKIDFEEKYIEIYEIYDLDYGMLCDCNHSSLKCFLEVEM